jgi:hypothetical protein
MGLSCVATHTCRRSRQATSPQHRDPRLCWWLDLTGLFMLTHIPRFTRKGEETGPVSLAPARNPFTSSLI